MRKSLSLLAAASICLCTSQAWAADQTAILAKPGTTIAMRVADQSRCADVVSRSPDSDLPGSDRPMVMANGASGGVPGVAGAAIAGLIIGLIILGEERDAGRAFCMRNLGWVGVPLTDDEAAAYKKLSKADKTKWEEAFLASDFSARYQPLVTPKVPPLPAYRSEPMAQGGLKIDEASLAAAASDIDGHGDIVTGKASRSRTAVLKTPIKTTAGNILLTAEPGAVFHQVDYRTQEDPLLRVQSATWCGPVMEIANGNTAKNFYCFTGRDPGYEIYRPSGQSWFAGRYTGGFVLPFYDQPITLEERAADDLGEMDFTITVLAVNRGSVDLAAYVHRGGRDAQVWARTLDFDKAGNAVLPLWGYRLTFARGAPHQVKVAFTHDGDGTGWRIGG